VGGPKIEVEIEGWSKHRRNIHLSPQSIQALTRSIDHRTIASTSTITHFIANQRAESTLYISNKKHSTTNLDLLRRTLRVKPATTTKSAHLQSSSNQPTMSTPTPNTLRSLYRSLLRELPPRTSPTPSPLATHLRSTFASASSTSPTATSSSTTTDKPLLHKVQEAEQLAMYLKAQRTYVTLVERYNPGADMSDEERVRLSARRVGMNLPVDYVKE
jgi:ATP synthase assembly factor FMC1